MQLNTNTLPTHEEYISLIEMKRKTPLGSIFPFIQSEYKIVSLAILSFFLVGLLYSFVRQFKDIVFYDTFNDAGVVTWLELLTFAGSIAIISAVNKIHAKHGVNRGTTICMTAMLGSYLGYGFLIVFDRFCITKGVFDEMMHGNKWTLRRLGLFMYPFKMVNNLVMTLFYTLLDTTTSFLMSCGYMMYFSSNVTHEQMSRYIFSLLMGGNAALFISVYIAKFMCRLINDHAVCGTKWLYYLLSIFISSGILSAVLLVKNMTDREFRRPLYVGHSVGAKSMSKARNSTGILESLRIATRTPWLFGMCFFAFVYSFATSVYSVSSGYTFIAYSKYLEQNPAMNNTPGQSTSSGALSSKYKTIECQLTSVISVYLMLLPVFKRLFASIGIMGFSSVVFFACLSPPFMSFIYATINYPFTNFGERALVTFGINASTASFKQEAIFNMIGHLLNKVSKYSFFDIIKENITTKINPEKRVVYKGIFDGLALKTGKLFASAYVILLSTICRKDDVRYFSFLTFIITAAFVSILAVFMVKVHADYETAVSNKSYLESGSKKIS